MRGISTTPAPRPLGRADLKIETKLSPHHHVIEADVSNFCVIQLEGEY